MRVVSFIVLLIFCCCLLQAQQVRMATYNIRFDNPKDAPANTWKDRSQMIPVLIRFHDFDVFGIQEAQPNQLADLETALPEYTVVADGKHNGQNASTIFFKTALFELLGSGNFWLSPHPDKPGKAWDAKHPRGCTWVQLREKKSGAVFFYFNTHLDHVGVEARKNSVALILQKIKEIAGDQPAMLSGDLNFSQLDPNYTTLQQSGLVQDAYELAEIKYLPNGTFNGFNITRNSIERIDHFFLTKHFKVTRYGVLTDSFGGKFPSDHFPVLIVAQLNKN
jgi:endonuclease/exonuclease/phosphatase family metal-dependent hydrolase